MTDPAPKITQEMLKLIGKIDEFKGQWRVFKGISRDRLSRLRHTATIESVGSSTRIEGSRLNDKEVEELLSRIEILRKMEAEQLQLERLSALAAQIVELFETHERLTLAQIVELTAANRNTAKAKLSELTKKSLLARHGKGRGVYYTRASQRCGNAVHSAAPASSPRSVRNMSRAKSPKVR